MDEEGASPPRNRVKILCSYGGKIMPRPSDRKLKYMGGVTRIIAVPRNITFAELMKKVASICEGDVVLKYQLMPDEMDTLVSVTCDEDVKHMLVEYDRHESKSSSSGGSPMLRAFLFPSNPITLANNTSDPTINSLEQRYIDAINGIVRPTSNGVHPIFAVSSSTGSSPKSITADTSNSDQDPVLSNGFMGNHQQELHKVHSSSNLVSIGPHQHPHHQHIPHNLPFVRPMPSLLTARNDAARFQMGQSAARYYSPPVRSCGWGGRFAGYCGHVDRCGGGIREGEGLPQFPMRQRWE